MPGTCRRMSYEGLRSQIRGTVSADRPKTNAGSWRPISSRGRAPFGASLLFLGWALRSLSVLLLIAGVWPSGAQERGETQELALGQAISLSVTAGESREIDFDLGDSEAAELLVQTSEPHIEFRIVSRAEELVESGRFRTSGWMIVPFAAGGRKHVRLLLNREPLVQDQAPVWVRVDSLRIPLDTLVARRRAVQLQATAQALHTSMRAQNVRQAVTVFQEVAFTWRAVNDKFAQAIALGGKAESLFELSQYSEATRVLDSAISLDGKNTYLHSWLAHLKARAFLDEWESDLADHAAQESLDLALAVHDPALTADALADRAEALYLVHDSSVPASAEKAISIARSIGLPETAAHALRCQAWYEEDQGHLSRALSLMVEAEASFSKAGDERLVLDSTEDCVHIESMAKEPYIALSRFFELEPSSKNSGNLVSYGVLLENVGAQYEALNRSDRAGLYYGMAETNYASAGFRSGQSLILGKLCALERRSHDLPNALKNCTKSNQIAEEIKDPKRIAITQWNLGQVYAEMGETLPALAWFNDALNISILVSDPRWESRERLSRGEQLAKLGLSAGALSEFENARLRSREAEYRAGELDAEYQIACWYVDNGRYEEATEELKLALDEIESARKTVSNRTLQASYFADERKCYELYVEMLMSEYDHQNASDTTVSIDASGSGADARALEISEAGRARGLLDRLSLRGERTLQQTDASSRNLMQSHIGVDRLFDQRLKLLMEGGHNRELQNNGKDLMRSLDALERVENAAHSAPSPVRSTRPMTSAAIQSASQSMDATYLEYALGSKRSFVWVINRGQMKAYSLPPRDEINRMVKKWRELTLSAAPNYGALSPQPTLLAVAAKQLQQLSARLSCTLLGTFVDKQITQLVIVPDGDLAMLPFASLPENGCVSSRSSNAIPLVVRHEVVLTPSLSIFLSQRGPPGKNRFKGEVAVIADPVFDLHDSRFAIFKARFRPLEDDSASLPRLPNTGKEADAIEEVVHRVHGQVLKRTGLNANLQTILSPTMRDYRIWHLATHGVYDQNAPGFSALVFSLYGRDGTPALGFLRAQDIAELDLRSELVVLSACDSTVGENLSGEGIMGLSYSFLQAGAKQVIASLWSVDDAVSRELMRKFYEEMMKNGNNAAEALRQSQLNIMHRNGTSAPYYWAGFELTSVGR